MGMMLSSEEVFSLAMEIEESGYVDLCFMPNQQLMVAKGIIGKRGFHNINIIKIPTGEVIEKLGEFQFFLENAASYDGRTVLLGTTERVYQGDGYKENVAALTTNGERLMCNSGDVGLYTFRIGYGGMYYMSCVNRCDEIRVWEVPNILVQIIKRLNEHDIDDLDISPDLKYIATVDEDADFVRLLEFDTLQEVFAHPLDIMINVDHVLSFSPDGKLLAVTGQYMLKILSVPDGGTVNITNYLELFQQIWEQETSGSGGGYIGVAFSSDGRYLILNVGDEHIIVLKPE